MTRKSFAGALALALLVFGAAAQAESLHIPNEGRDNPFEGRADQQNPGRDDFFDQTVDGGVTDTNPISATRSFDRR